MACEKLACCQFFKEKMNELPKTAEYIRTKICLGDYEFCVRFRIYQKRQV